MLPEIWVGDPGFGIEESKKHWIPDPQHWKAGGLFGAEEYYKVWTCIALKNTVKCGPVWR